MTWDATKPAGTTKIKDSPVYFTDNWAALATAFGLEHYAFTTSRAGAHEPGKVGCMYVGTAAGLSGLWAAPPTGSIAMVTDPVSGVLALFACTSSAGSGVWTNYSPSHLLLSDLASGDPHTQYLNTRNGGTVNGSVIVSGSVAISGSLAVSGSITAVGSIMACGNPQADNEVTTKAWILNNALSGHPVQVVNTQTATVLTGSTAIPLDDTPPLSGEGDQFLSLAITPHSASNYLRIEVHIHLANNTYGSCISALFKDSDGSALAAGISQTAQTDTSNDTPIVYYMVAGTTSEITFKVRAGSAGGRTTLNGRADAQLFGGTLYSSITITEIGV